MAGRHATVSKAACGLALLALLAAPGLLAGGESGDSKPDARYRLEVETTPPPSSDMPGALLVRVEPREGWHIAPEAPASLVVEPEAGARVTPLSQKSEDARALSEQRLEFACRFDPAPRDGSASGRLKFGVCRDGDTGCAIVRLDLDLTLPRAGSDTSP